MSAAVSCDNCGFAEELADARGWIHTNNPAAPAEFEDDLDLDFCSVACLSDYLDARPGMVSEATRTRR